MTSRTNTTLRASATNGLDRRRFLALTGAAAVTAAAWTGQRPASAAQLDTPDSLRMDFAYYNPSSLVLRRHGWLEEELPELEVTWTLSACNRKK